MILGFLNLPRNKNGFTPSSFDGFPVVLGLAGFVLRTGRPSLLFFVTGAPHDAHTGAMGSARLGVNRGHGTPNRSIRKRGRQPEGKRPLNHARFARRLVLRKGKKPVQARREAEGARAASRQKSGRWKKAGSSERRRARRSGEPARRVTWPSLRPGRGDLP